MPTSYSTATGEICRKHKSALLTSTTSCRSQVSLYLYFSYPSPKPASTRPPATNNPYAKCLRVLQLSRSGLTLLSRLPNFLNFNITHRRTRLTSSPMSTRVDRHELDHRVLPAQTHPAIADLSAKSGPLLSPTGARNNKRRPSEIGPPNLAMSGPSDGVPYSSAMEEPSMASAPWGPRLRRVAQILRGLLLKNKG